MAQLKQIKDGLLALNVVGGTRFEKIFYYVVLFGAIVMFILSCITIAMVAGKEITEISLYNNETVPFPAVGICLDNEMPLETIEWTASEEYKQTPLPGHANVGNWLKRKFTADLPPKNSALQDELRKKMETRGDEMSCYVINSDGQAVAKMGDSIILYMSISNSGPLTPGVQYIQNVTCFAENGATGSLSSEEQDRISEKCTTRKKKKSWGGRGTNVVMLLDPVKTIEEQVVNFHEIPFAFPNAVTNVGYSIDVHIDKRNAGMIERLTESTRFGEDKDVTMKFSGTASSTQRYAYIGYGDPAIEDWITTTTTTTIQNAQLTTYEYDDPKRFRLSSMIVITPNEHTYRTVSRRYKSLPEVWTEVGAAWAASLLVVAIFFVKKEVPVRDEKNNIKNREMQVLRYRTRMSKQQLMTQFQESLEAAKGVDAPEI